MSPGITETGKVDNQGSPVANAFSLQLNTQFFSGSPACSLSSDPANCLAWQQFVYSPQNGTGFVYMQYWLINYDATCPAGWLASSADCFRNSNSATMTPLTAGELATVQLSGSATSGGQDGVLLSVGSGQATLVTNGDSVLDLARAWNTTEWGVYGDGGGGQAQFGASTTLEAQTAITTTSSSAPACVSESFTAETNNLSLTSTPGLGSEPSPTLASEQTNGTVGSASCAAGAARGGLNAGGDAQVKSVSCGSAGNCSAGGFYYDSSGSRQVFVVTQSGGIWGTAKEVAGSAALNAGGAAAFDSVSCGSAGNCSAGGDYTDSSGHEQAFLVSRSGGTFGTAKEVAGTAALNAGGAAVIASVSCPPSGSCSAGGHYTDGFGIEQAFVVSQASGTFGTAEEVPGTAALNTNGAEIDSVSCASAGNCSAGGYYIDSSGRFQVFVDSQAGGTWGQAEQVPGTAALNTGGSAAFESVSCASAGNCSAGGDYRDSAGHVQAFVASQAGGTWGQARETGALLNTGGNAQIQSVSCASAGNCSAGGWYTSSSGFQQAFVVNQVNGTWGSAKEVPGTAALNTGGSAAIDSVSCASAGNCSAGGYYWGSSGFSAFVVSQVNGTWGSAKEVPGTPALSTGSAAIDSVSCASAGNCSAGGTYRDSSGHHQALVVSQAGGTWGQAEEVPGTNS